VTPGSETYDRQRPAAIVCRWPEARSSAVPGSPACSAPIAVCRWPREVIFEPDKVRRGGGPFVDHTLRLRDECQRLQDIHDTFPKGPELLQLPASSRSQPDPQPSRMGLDRDLARFMVCAGPKASNTYRRSLATMSRVFTTAKMTAKSAHVGGPTRTATD
jgi:hypothetical protein